MAGKSCTRKTSAGFPKFPGYDVTCDIEDDQVSCLIKRAILIRCAEFQQHISQDEE